MDFQPLPEVWPDGLPLHGPSARLSCMTPRFKSSPAYVGTAEGDRWLAPT